jgi:hypothetical protein
VAPLFHEAQRLDRFGRHSVAAELYQNILKTYPELDTVREEYARSLWADNKSGKAAEAWEELCRRNPDNPRYARELGRCYVDRGWHKKGKTELRRALALDPASIEAWTLYVSIFAQTIKPDPDSWDELEAAVAEALETVRDVRAEEWRKISLHVEALLAAGIKKVDVAQKHLREIIRLIRENGREGRDEGQSSLDEILLFVPVNSLASLYPDLQEMAALLPDLSNAAREQLDAVRLGAMIEGLVAKKYDEIFCDLFRILNDDFEEGSSELEVAAIEYHILDDKRTFDPQLRRLKEEFPELYALHASFFDTALRTRDPEKLLHRLFQKIRKGRHLIGYDDDEPDPEAPVTVRRAQPKVGRNDPCPCGSGKKYKHCCGA